jgi:hypothetical protein
VNPPGSSRLGTKQITDALTGTLRSQFGATLPTGLASWRARRLFAIQTAITCRFGLSNGWKRRWRCPTRGIASMEFFAHPSQDAKALNDGAVNVRRRFGVSWQAQRIVAISDLSSVADSVWRVALAASEVAALTRHFQPRRKRRERDFARLIERDFRARRVAVDTQRALRGTSGHPHHATIFIPATEAVIEPVSPQGHWNQVSTVYAKFGDLGQANGYRLFAVVDDRKGQLATDLASMLVQVSGVVEWTRRKRVA